MTNISNSYFLRGKYFLPMIEIRWAISIVFTISVVSSIITISITKIEKTLFFFNDQLFCLVLSRYLSHSIHLPTRWIWSWAAPGPTIWWASRVFPWWRAWMTSRWSVGSGSRHAFFLHINTSIGIFILNELWCITLCMNGIDVNGMNRICDVVYLLVNDVYPVIDLAYLRVYLGF